MPEITILGSAAGDASSERTHASVLIEVNGELYQFDAGEGVSSSIKRRGIDISRIGVIFLSHMHSDHVAGIFMELQSMHLAERRDPILVYVPSEAMNALETFLKATYLFEENLGFGLTLKPIIPDPVFRDENVTLYARANRHLRPYAGIIEGPRYANKLESYSFVIKTETAKIIYSGDVDSVEDYADLLPECDLLITEGLHVERKRLFEAVSMNAVRHLVITHLTDETYSRADELRTEAEKFGVSNFHIAYDGLSLSI